MSELADGDEMVELLTPAVCRSDTNSHQKEDDDSGIETICASHLAMTTIGRKRKSKVQRTAESSAADDTDKPRRLMRSKRAIRIDDLLWFICFALMLPILNVPDVLLFNRKVDWYYLKLAISFHLFTITVALVFHLLNFLHVRLAFATLLPTRSLLCSSMLASGISFCLATWEVFNVWSIYIVAVSAMSYLALIAIV